MKQIVEFIKKDWQVKLAMLIIAIGLWLYVSAGQVRTDTFPGAIKIEPRNTPNGTVALLSEDYAELVISADESIWESLKPDSLDVFVDLENYDIGTHEVQVQATSSSQDAEIVSISPKTVFVSIEPVITSELPITVVIEGDPADGYIVGSYSANPEKVTLSGARSVITGISQVTAQIDLDGEAESFEKEVQLQATNIKENITFNPSKATVKIDIVKSGQNKTVGIEPTVTGTPADGYYVSAIAVTPATVSLNGPADLLSSLSTLSTESISVDGLKSDLSTIVNLSIPSGISSSESQVNIKISISKISTP